MNPLPCPRNFHRSGFPRRVMYLLAMLSAFVIQAHAAPLSGTKTVGPTGNYASIGAAIADVQAQTLGGALVLELQAAYVGTVETFPLTIPALNGASAVNTVTIRPASGAVALNITSANTTAATVDLNGAQFVTFDGRPGGAGTAKQLTIANTSTSGVAVRFINESSSNTLMYLTLQGANTSATSGTVVFSTTTGTNGNDNNTIDTCDIRDGVTTPTNAIYSSGTTTTTARNNSGNTVSNCNIFNFYAAAAGDAAGLLLDAGNTDWIISGNSFYQTVSSVSVPANVRPIFVNNSSGNNFVITGNFIGGSAPNAGGVAWTTTGTTLAYAFTGIQLTVGNTTPSSVQGNTVKNIVWTTSGNATAVPGVWCGIYVTAGSANVGTATGNTIGSGSGTGSISVTTSGNGGTTFGISSGIISSGAIGTVSIANNTVGSIVTNGTDTSISAALTGIQINAGTNIVSNNTVGSTTTASSLNAATSATSTTGGALSGQKVAGIVGSSNGSTSITGNTIANLNNNHVGTGFLGIVRGIDVLLGANTITGNTVRNLSTTSQTADSTGAASVLGIKLNSSFVAGQTVSQNVVHSLSNTAASAAVTVTGIYYQGHTTNGTNVIARNFVHSLSIASTSTSSQLIGIMFEDGTFTARNNMVRVGLDASGVSTAGSSLVRALYDSALTTTSVRNLYHNSAFVGGTSTSTAATFAFINLSANSTSDIRNNIFVNTRSGTGTHYAVRYAGSTPNPAGLTANNNVFYVSGTGTVLGQYNFTNRTTLAAWQTATGVDAASLNADPLFVNPNGTAATGDLHIQTTSPASNAGTPIAGVTDDFDGQTRSGTVPDIGADEFNSTNANLASLTLSTGTLSPVFASGTTSYTASVSNATASITVTPTLADLGATVTVNGGSPATPVALNFGANTITVLITAQDLSTKTYTITVTRQILAPTVTTPTSAGISTATATLGGNVTSDGGAAVTVRGVVISATATNNNPTVGGTGVTNLTTTGTTGVFTVNASGLTQGTQYSFAAYATNSVGTTYTSPVSTFTTLAPDIAVEQPVGTGIADSGSQSFGNVSVGGSASLTFTIRNPGTVPLTGLGITFDGTDASQFSVTALPVAPVAAGGSTTFTVQFTPTVGGSKSAALHIASNVSGAKNPYDISLTAFTPSPAPLSGTRTVGPTGYYSSLTQAIADIQSATLGGPLVLELQPSYVSTVETFPLMVPALNGASAVNTVTIRPQTGATGLSITSADTTAATVDLNGTRFVTFDGRPGGAGTAKQLTIANTSTSGVAVRFINEASSNTLRHLTLQGVNTSATSGTVVFSTTTGANGNDNNTIDTCDVRDGASTPINGIYSLGSTGTAAQNNGGNTVSNCNVLNFYHTAAVDTAGVRLDGGSTDWTISGNSFYQTVARAGQGAHVRAIYVNNVSGNNFTVTGNFIGGTAPNAGGAAWPGNTSISFSQFQGIRLNVGTSVASSVQGNTVSNVVWKSTDSTSALPGQWTGIYVVAGSVNIGSVTGNTVGSGTGTSSISIPASSTSSFAFGIGSSSSGTVAVANNAVGAITMNPSGTNSSPTLIGIQVTAGTNTISGNTVGSTTTANSLNVPSASTNVTFVEQVTGILSTSATIAVISNNIVANLNSNYAGTVAGSQVRGIVTTAGVNAITGNSVSNLSTTSPVTGTATSSSVLGIAQSSATAGQTVSQNVVRSLSNTAASAAVTVTGVFYSGNVTTGTNVIARNLVHSLSILSTSGAASLRGMEFGNSFYTAQNNMVRLGFDANGTGTAGATGVYGIFDSNPSNSRNLYNNSVYIGGTETSGAASTFAFSSAGATNTRVFRDNIFVNARGNSGGTGKHYAVQYGGTTVNPTGLTASNNIFFASGTGGVFGLYNGADRATLTAWQTATGVDAASLSADPLFVNPAGTAVTGDLHVLAGTPASNAGTPIAAVTDDFDGQTRSGTVPDIGADEFASTNANLANLTLNTGTLTPVFSTNTLSYTATTTSGSITVTPTVADVAATVTVNGGSPATPVALNVGANTITVLVTAQDLSTKTYTITVTRQAAPSVTTPTSAGITTTTATLGGNVTGDGSATITARGVVISATATNGNPTIGGTGVTNITASGTTGVFTVSAGPLASGTQHSFAAYATNSIGTTYTSPVSTFTTIGPDIAVEQPAGTGIADGGSQSFGVLPVGGSASLTFTIRNTGTAALTGLGITMDGADVSQFSITAFPVAPVAAGGSTTFTVQFTSAGIGGKSAALHIASNVSGAKNPYDISITAFTPSTAPLSGTMTVGPTGYYLSLTQAIADIQSATLGGPLVLELQPAYVSTVETFPLVFANLGTTAANTLTVRPQPGAAGLSIISADVTAATVDLNGAQFVTIDGRAGGTGTAKQLIIGNTSTGTSGVAVRFINEASSNTLRHLTLQGVNLNPTSGTVLFSTTTGANGNDNNTIDSCDIRDGATTPANAIYSLGTTTTTAQYNSGNTVSNCNVFNFYSTGLSTGVQLAIGNTDWTLNGNSFYQTAVRTAGVASVLPIQIANTSGNNFTVTGNFIGGSAPGAGGTAWTTTGTSKTNLFQGIRLAVGITTPSSVQGNTIRNIVWTSSSNDTLLPGVWSGIYVSAGSANIGTVMGNTVGSGSGTGSISVTTSGSSGTAFGIGSASAGTVAIASNTIGSITSNGTDTTISASLTGIQVTAGTNTIASNTVGSTTASSSLNAATSTTTAGINVQQVTGILSSSSGGAIIMGNTVANLNNNYAGAGIAGQVRGIVANVGVNTIVGNTVRNLATTSQNSGSTIAASVLGISQSSTAAGQTVSQNIVHSLANTSSASVKLVGIYYAGSTTTGPNIIARNLVHSLSITSTTSSFLYGMYCGTGTFTAQNNMVCVGLDANGIGTAGASQVTGISDAATTAGRNFYHNSSHVGGTQTSGTSGSFAFGSQGTTNTRDFRNNVFVNARSNSGGTGKHYAVFYLGTGANPAGLTANNNIFFVSGTGGVLGLYSVDRTTIAAWQSATGVDLNSLNANPLYMNPTGTAATVDLHLQSGSPARTAAATGIGVTDDFDGDTRSLTTPDIGADEFRFANDANLTSLTLSTGAFSPVFAMNTLSYTAAVSNGTTTMTFTPTLSSVQASVTVNGNSAATPVTLAVGSSNVVSITVTAQDGTMKTYTVTVTRNTVFQDWALANGVSSDPSLNGANGVSNLLNFAFGIDPTGGASGVLVFSGSFGAGGTIGAKGQPITMLEPIANGVDFRVLYVRRKDYVTAGLTYAVEFSPANLAPWTAGAAVPTVLADDGFYQIVSVPFPPFISGKKARFFRVRTTLAP